MIDERTRHLRDLDYDGPIPLFHQLAARLRSSIFTCVYRPHDQLPSEPELCRLYGISRATVRMALDKLVEQRLVYRLHGKGTFVSPPEPRLALFTSPSLSREMRLRGIEPMRRILNISRRPVPPAVATFIASADGLALHYEGLFFGDGEPFAMVRSYWNPALNLTAEDLAPSRDPALDLSAQDLAPDLMESDVLLETCGVRITDASCIYIEPLLLGERDAAILDVPPGTVGLDMARLLIDQTGCAVAYVQTVFRGDRCRLLFSSRNASPGAARDAPAMVAQ